jgi:hypothetical protein
MYIAIRQENDIVYLTLPVGSFGMSLGEFEELLSHLTAVAEGAEESHNDEYEQVLDTNRRSYADIRPSLNSILGLDKQVPYKPLRRI